MQPNVYAYSIYDIRVLLSMNGETYVGNYKSFVEGIVIVAQVASEGDTTNLTRRDQL
jgi:hypothetical protein